MSHRDLNVTVTGVPAGSDASSGRKTSRLCALCGAQPKPLPARDHQTWSPEGTIAGSMIWRAGRRATYASPLLTLGPVRVYGSPFASFQSLRAGFIL